MNGRSGQLPDAAALGAMAAARAARQAREQPTESSPGNAVANYLGLGVLQMQAMKAVELPCVCGRCQGICVQFEGRIHFLPNGAPEIIRRPDHSRMPTPAEGTPKEGDKP
jgi:hypothetical protein